MLLFLATTFKLLDQGQVGDWVRSFKSKWKKRKSHLWNEAGRRKVKKAGWVRRWGLGLQAILIEDGWEIERDLSSQNEKKGKRKKGKKVHLV
jgi:hypothetical protein